MEPDALIAALATAAETREALPAELRCYRMFHGYGEGVDGLTIDRYDRAVVVRFRADLEALLPVIVEHVTGLDDIDLVTARPRGFGVEPRAIVGALPSSRTPVSEGPMSLLLDFARAGNPGLFLDGRPAREWIGANSRDRRVLNLFSFTGSLGIAASLGGARSVVHVDSHRPTLAWARANAAHNGVRCDDRDFARLNVYQHLRKQQTARQRFGGIVLDPPPSPEVPRQKDRTPGLRGVAALAPMAARMLEPGGWLLCFFHHDGRDHDAIDGEIAAACGLDVLWRGTSGADYPDARRSDGDGARLRLTAFVRP